MSAPLQGSNSISDKLVRECATELDQSHRHYHPFFYSLQSSRFDRGVTKLPDNFHWLCSVDCVVSDHFLACTWRHRVLKSETKETSKILSSSSIRGAKSISVYHFSAQQLALSGNLVVRDISYEHVCPKIYTYLVFFSLFRSRSIRKRACVSACLFNTDNQSPR